MTYISPTVPNTIRRLSLLRPSFPRLAIGAPLNDVCRLIGEAFTMAYADPYARPRRQPQFALDDDLEGRDPSW